MRCERIHALAADILWPLAILTTIGVVAGSLVPARAIPRFAPDYLLHSAGYLVVALTWLLAVVWCPGTPGQVDHHARRIRAFVVVTAVVAMGAIIELLQNFVGRTTDPRDLVANTFGVAIAWTFWTTLVGICDLAAASRGVDHRVAP